MKKNILLILMLIAAVVVMPRVHADENGGVDITIHDDVKFTIKDNTASDTKVSGTSSINVDDDVITITYNAGEFKLLDDNSGHRPDNKAWIGFSITFPTTGITKYTLKNEVTTRDIVTDGVIHDENDKVVNVYTAFDDADLRTATDNATNAVYTYTLTITPTSESGSIITKTIKVVVAPDGITLKPKNGEEPVWDNDEYKEEVEKVMTEIYSDLEEAISQAKGIDTSKYTTESVKALEDAIKAAEAEATDKDVTTNNQDEIKALKQALEDAIDSLEDKPIEIGDVSNISAENPKTGDTIIACAFVALLLIAVIIVLSVKKSSHRI